MADWHYHANHIDAPARGSKAAAMKDARSMHALYDSENHRVNALVSAETIREHGVEFPLIVRCFRDCTIKRAEVAVMREP